MNLVILWKLLATWFSTLLRSSQNLKSIFILLSLKLHHEEVRELYYLSSTLIVTTLVYSLQSSPVCFGNKFLIGFLASSLLPIASSTSREPNILLVQCQLILLLCLQPHKDFHSSQSKPKYFHIVWGSSPSSTSQAWSVLFFKSCRPACTSAWQTFHISWGFIPLLLSQVCSDDCPVSNHDPQPLRPCSP